MASAELDSAAARWDALLSRWPGANLLQSFGWGEVQARAGWQTHRLELETGAGLLPLTALSTPLGVPGRSRLYLPRGPVCAADDLGNFALVQGALVELGKRCGALVLELEAGWEEGQLPPDHPWLSWPRCRARQPLATVVADLGREPEEIIRGFSSKSRYNVRLAERRGVLVGEGTVDELLTCVAATQERQRIHLPGRRHLQLVLEQLGEQAWIQVARVEGETVAAILIAAAESEAVYLYGGATGRHRDRMPNHLLHWEAMLKARERGLLKYDLWGIPDSDDPQHPWRGLAQFKLGFGGRTVRYAGARSLELRRGGAAMVATVDRLRQVARGAVRR